MRKNLALAMVALLALTLALAAVGCAQKKAEEPAPARDGGYHEHDPGFDAGGHDCPAVIPVSNLIA